MSRQELRRGSPKRPDPQRDGGGSPLSPLYRSFFEDECRTIAARLLTGSGPVTSTPLKSSPPPAAGSPSGSAFLGRSRGASRRLVLPRALGRFRPQPRRVGQFLPARSPGRAAGRPSPARRASVGAGGGAGRGAGTGPGVPASKLPVPLGAKLKTMPAAKSRLQHPTSRASQLALPSAGTRAPPHRDKAMETAGKAGGRRQPPQRLRTGIPTVVSRSRLQPAGKVAPSSKHTYLGCTSESTSQEPVCNRTRELMENDKADQMRVCVGSPYVSALHPCPAPGCGNAACAAQCAVWRTCAGLLHGSLHPLTPCPCQLSQEHVKKELERVKGELADKAAKCEAYCQTISSLQAQLRAAGICPEDAAEDKPSISERN
ncbi:uncharacterized protein LOC116229603 isoform X2 [Phasianus colchicus]|uniref:uncharacterized protein LOC116229603 isoform X2 n=1 Tax=Phasianus colchicus TaxID=9054 RepID=UPI00129DB337|nr:uncharacterized protein LOC116229603 isoform X2 [Phasianus colchicus]